MKRDNQGRFLKGNIPEVHFEKGYSPWNKGFTKEDHPSISKTGFQEGHKNGFKKGKENPRYTGFIHKKYKIMAIEWLAIRQIILERDLFTCQSCGKNHHETLLDVHHKIPFRISEDNSLRNLITLCRSCHMKEEKAITKEIQINHRRLKII